MGEVAVAAVTQRKRSSAEVQMVGHKANCLKSARPLDEGSEAKTMSNGKLVPGIVK